ARDQRERAIRLVVQRSHQLAVGLGGMHRFGRRCDVEKRSVDIEEKRPVPLQWWQGARPPARRRTSALPPLQRDWAFFLDIDGTLLDIAPTPKSVHTAKADCKLVAALYDKADGALALVSG